MGKKLTGLVVAMILAGSAGMGAVMGMMGGPEKQRSVRPSIVVGGGAVTNGSADADAPQEQAAAPLDAPGAEGYLLPADGSWSAALDQAAAERAEAERLAAEAAAAAAAQRSAQQVKAGPKKAAPKPVYRDDDDDDDDDEWDDDDDDEYDD